MTLSSQIPFFEMAKPFYFITLLFLPPPQAILLYNFIKVVSG